MAVNETIVTGRKFRKLTDAASKKWQRISFWHKASDCEFNDGKTAEEKLGAIKGITTDLNVTVPGYAADATRVSELNNSLNNSLQWTLQGKIINSRSEISYPTNYNELYIIANRQYGKERPLNDAVIVPKVVIDDAESPIRVEIGTRSTVCEFLLSKTGVSINSLVVNNNELTNGYCFSVYYR